MHRSAHATTVALTICALTTKPLISTYISYLDDLLAPVKVTVHEKKCIKKRIETTVVLKSKKRPFERLDVLVEI